MYNHVQIYTCTHACNMYMLVMHSICITQYGSTVYIGMAMGYSAL